MVTYLGGSILITIFALGGSIVSYNLQMNSRFKANVAADALTMALFRHKIPTKVIVHSEWGLQYCSDKYQKLLKHQQPNM
jgi:transposase InsO family protein